MSITIRAATIKDYDWVLEQSHKFMDFFGSKFNFVPNGDRALVFFKNLIENHLFLIAEDDGVKTGFIAGLVSPNVFNDEITNLTEILWWVDEDYRLGRSGSMLLDAFVDWGRENCDAINFTLETKSPIKDKTLEKRGFVLKERAFLLECT